MNYFELRNVTKKFGDKVALDDVSVSASEPSIIGLVGKNGSGKTTLLRHIVGLQLPTTGACTAFETPTPLLDAAQLERLGMAHQQEGLLGWMKAGQLVRYVSSFYDTWDAKLEARLMRQFEIDPTARVQAMSPGNRQKLSIVLAVCHHPALLLLDEPLSDLDPIVRRDVVKTLLDQFRDDEMVIVMSSHMLQDMERIADRIICLHEGRVVADSPLDELKEQYGGNLDEVFRVLVGAAV